MKLLPITLIAAGLLTGCVSTEAAYQRGLMAGYAESNMKELVDRMDKRHMAVVELLAAERQARIDAENVNAGLILTAEGATWEDGWNLRGNYERKTAENRANLIAAIQDSAADRAVGHELARIPRLISEGADAEQQTLQRVARFAASEAIRIGQRIWAEKIAAKSRAVPEGSEAEDPSPDAHTQQQLDEWNTNGYPG